ncbi:ketopantoate reductase family protein [Sphingomonas sp. GCM10030256]|uniref:ketopantoate reductase family protein n=1 Tax=Sphingomonas sp. GCM10030256 TaxID=3273427 RepID=UPI0036118F6C
MRVGVAGVGAIGGWLAARLALAGHQVTCLARGATLEALRSGLSLREGGTDRQFGVEASDTAAGPPRDLVIIATKAMALADVAEMVQPWVGPATLILPLQNGVPWWFVDRPLAAVDPDGRVAAALPMPQVMGAVVHAACKRVGAAAVEVVRADRLLLGEPGGGPSERVQELVSLFADAGIPAEASVEIRKAIWYKLWGNMTINPLSALTRVTADRLLGEAGLKPFILSAMAEAAAIGAAIGCPITESGVDRMGVTAKLGAFKTSMLQDVEAGRPLEAEALVGAPREIAHRNGIPCPSIDALYGMIRLLDSSRQ